MTITVKAEGTEKERARASTAINEAGEL